MRSAFRNQNQREKIFQRGVVQISTNLRCAIFDVILVVSKDQPTTATPTPFSADNSEIDVEVSMPQVFQKNFHGHSSDERQKMSFHALDRRNNGCLTLVHTKTKTYARNA